MSEQQPALGYWWAQDREDGEIVIVEVAQCCGSVGVSRMARCGELTLSEFLGEYSFLEPVRPPLV